MGLGEIRMIRALLAIALMAGLVIYIRHQYHDVMRQATSRSPRPMMKSPFSTPQESRRKCLLCNGTGRSVFAGMNFNKSHRSEACSSCRGSGWVDNPLYNH